MGSIVQRAAKLQAVKVRSLKKVCCPASALLLPVDPILLQPGPNDSESLTDGNFAALPTEPILAVWKDLTPFPMHNSSSRGWQHFKAMFFPLKMTSFS